MCPCFLVSVDASVLLNRDRCAYVSQFITVDWGNSNQISEAAPVAAAARPGFDELNKAYNVLSDQQKRERYDEKLPDGIQWFFPAFIINLKKKREEVTSWIGADGAGHLGAYLLWESINIRSSP